MTIENLRKEIEKLTKIQEQEKQVVKILDLIDFVCL